MTFETIVGWTLLRTTFIAVAVVACAGPIASWFETAHSGWRRKLAAALVLAPLPTPRVVVAYAYSASELSLVRHPWANEGRYVALLAMLLLPVAVGVMYFSPHPAVSSEAQYCRRLLPVTCSIARGRIGAGWSFTMYGPLPKKLMAFIAVFLLAFQDFELASLFQLHRPPWTVWLFDAHAGGLAIGESLRAAFVPAACQALVLTVGINILIRTRNRADQLDTRANGSASGSVFMWCYLFGSFFFVCVLPALLVLKGTFEGMGVLIQDFQIVGELWSALVLASSATIFAWVAARYGAGRRHIAWAPTLILCIPGLLGNLVLGLAVLWLFQTTHFAALYDTPVPLLLLMTLLLLPFAVVLCWALDASEPGSALHLSGMLKQASTNALRRTGFLLHWHMRGRMRWCVVWLLFLMAYFDVVGAAMLAPTRMTPASLRLYNQMHYGSSGVLSAMVCVMVLTPLLLGILTFTAGTMKNLLPWRTHV